MRNSHSFFILIFQHPITFNGAISLTHMPIFFNFLAFGQQILGYCGVVDLACRFNIHFNDL